MFKAVVERDDYEKLQTHYYLTQGDSCVIYATPYKNGEALPLDQVEKCVFKLSDSNYQQKLSRELSVFDGHFRLELTSEDTASLSVQTYYYEFEYTLIGGAVQTPNQWEFDITHQIVQ